MLADFFDFDSAFRAFFGAIKTRFARILAFKRIAAPFADAMINSHALILCVILAALLLPCRACASFGAVDFPTHVGGNFKLCAAMGASFCNAPFCLPVRVSSASLALCFFFAVKRLAAFSTRPQHNFFLPSSFHVLSVFFLRDSASGAFHGAKLPFFVYGGGIIVARNRSSACSAVSRIHGNLFSVVVHFRFSFVTGNLPPRTSVRGSDSRIW